MAKAEVGLSAQRIYQDLVGEKGLPTPSQVDPVFAIILSEQPVFRVP
jgi:hypothetical protein